jgi:hypothetical protein
MKGFIIALVIIMVVCLGIAGLVFTVGGGLDIFRIPFLGASGTNTYDINETVSAPAGSYEEISIGCVSTDINVVKWDNDYPKAELVGSITLKGDKPELVVTYDGNSASFNVKYPNLFSYSIFRSSLKLTLYIPRGYNQGLSMNTVSGDIYLSGYSLTKLFANSVSGKVGYDNIAAGEIFSTTVSGNITAVNIVSGNTSFNSTSGDITLEGSPGTVSARTISGRVDIGYTGDPDKCDISTVSGKVKLELAAGTGCELEYSTTSGDLSTKGQTNILTGKRNYYRLVAGTSGNKAEIKVSTVSGDLDLVVN